MTSRSKKMIGSFFLVLTIWSGLAATESCASQEFRVEGYVSAIKSTYLYLNGQRYFLAPTVKFTLETEYGRRVSAREVYTMRWIARARVHIRDNKVTGVTILKMEQ